MSQNDPDPRLGVVMIVSRDLVAISSNRNTPETANGITYSTDRDLVVDGDRVTVTNSSKRRTASGLEVEPGSRLTVTSEPVADAVKNAVRNADAGRFTRQEGVQLDRLREMVARHAVDDGRFDVEETQQIVALARQIGSNERGR